MPVHRFKKGEPRPAKAGRKKGVPNKITRDIRATITLLSQRNVGELEKLLDRVALKDPARAAQLHIQILEFNIPKLQRTEMTGLDGAAFEVSLNQKDSKL
jgi:hypothetical protein